MTEEARFANWARGMTNRAQAHGIPEGFARDLLNLYPTPDGRLKLRPGGEQVYSGADVRGLFSVAGSLVVFDGTEIRRISSGTSVVVGTVPEPGRVTGAVLNNELYFSSGNYTGVLSATGLRDWGVPLPLGVSCAGADVVVTSEDSSRDRGLRRVACTFTTAEGVEGGAVAGIPAGAQVTVPEPPAGGMVNLYVTEKDGGVYYLYGSYAASTTVDLGLTSPANRMLQDMHKQPPVPGDFIVESGGVLCIASGSAVFTTLPFDPHAMDVSRDFFMYPEAVNAMCSGLDGVYVSADKCYKLVGVGTSDVRQQTVLDYPATSKTMQTLPDGSAAWITEYGMAVETPTAQGITVSEPNKGTFVVGATEGVSSGQVDHDGNQLFVANVAKRQTGPSPLAAAGFFEAEVERP